MHRTIIRMVISIIDFRDLQHDDNLFREQSWPFASTSIIDYSKINVYLLLKVVLFVVIKTCHPRLTSMNIMELNVY